jgi:hypothetical protein
MIGYYNEDPIINPDEVEDWKWMGICKENMVLFPEQYTVWFKIILMSFTIFLEITRFRNFLNLKYINSMRGLISRKRILTQHTVCIEKIGREK